MECRGGGICKHGWVRYRCQECGGGPICKHGWVEIWCKLCTGGAGRRIGDGADRRSSSSPPLPIATAIVEIVPYTPYLVEQANGDRRGDRSGGGDGDELGDGCGAERQGEEGVADEVFPSFDDDDAPLAHSCTS